MAFVDAQFPDTLALGSHGGPMFQTGIVVTIDGTESRGRALRYARGKWEVGLVNRDEDVTRTLNAFFRVVAVGRLNTFLFKDRAPGEARGINELLGTGDGVTPFYLLVKNYTVGSQSYRRLIAHPDEATMIVTVDGTPTDFVFDPLRAMVTLIDVPTVGQEILATYDFLVAVRFDTDRLPITFVEPGLYTWDSITLLEERVGSPGQFLDALEPPILSGIITSDGDPDYNLFGALTWTEGDGAGDPILGYRLYRIMGDATPTEVLVTTSSQFYNDPIERNDVFTYAVTLYTVRGESALSNLVLLEAVDTPPELARNISQHQYAAAGPGYIDVFAGWVDLSWTAAIFIGGEPVSFYRVYRQVFPADPDVLVVQQAGLIFTNASEAGVTNFPVFQEDVGPWHNMDPDLPQDEDILDERFLRYSSYTYKIIAHSVTGHTSTSNIITAHHDTVVPGSPENVVATFMYAGMFTPSSILIDWDPPADHGSIPEANLIYWIQVSIDSGPWTLLDEAVLPPAGHGNIIADGKTYKYRVFTYDDWGRSAWVESNTVTASP